MDKRAEKFVERQDWLCYYGIHTLDKSIGILDSCKIEEGMRYSEILERMSQVEEEILRQFSIKNLMHILSSNRLKEEDRERIIHVIEEKVDQEEFYMEDLMKEFFLKPISIGGIEYSKLPTEVSGKIKDLVLQRAQAVKGTNCEKIASHFTRVIDYASFLSCFEKGEFSDEKVLVIEEALAKNSEALRHVNFSLFQDDIYGVMGKEFIAYAMKFPNLSAQLNILSKANPKLLEVIGNKAKETSDLKESVNLLEELVQYCTNNCYEISQNERIEPQFLMDAALRSNRAKRDEALIAIPYSKQYGEELERAFQEEYEKIASEQSQNFEYGYKGIHFKITGNVSRLTVMKNLYLNQYFSMSLTEAEKFVEIYGQNLEDMELESGRILLQQIKQVLEAETLESISFQESLKLSAEGLENVKRQLEKEYAFSYIPELQKTDSKIQSSKEKKQVDFKGPQISIIEAPEDFSILVHSTGAGFVNENKMTEEENYRDKWKTSDLQFNHVISMSYVNQDFLGMAPVTGSGVIYGFSTVDVDAIKLMGNTDINTFSNEFGYNAAKRKYLTANAMPYQSRRVYNEFGVERNGTNPDYVLLFDDSTEENIQSAYKAASQWEIPILFYDKTKIKDRQISRLEELRVQFEETQDPEVLQELLNTYETNMAGWLLNRKKDEEDKSYTQEIDHERFRESFDIEYQKIARTIDRYLEEVERKKEAVPNFDLVRIMQIVLEERDLYQKCDETKPTSKTAITIDTEEILSKLNQTMRAVGLDEFTIGFDKIPTAKEYKKTISMKQLMQHALLKQKITIEEVETAEQALSMDKEKEENREEHE